MEWLQRKISGVGDTRSPQPQQQPPPVASEDAAALLRTQRIRLKQKEAELQTISEELSDALDAGDAAKQRIKLQRKRDLEAELRQLRGKIANQSSVADTLATADADLQQARVLHSGAKQLENIVKQTEQMDIDDIVDTYQENAKMSHQFGSRLSEPLFSSSAAGDDVDAEDIDDELARMQEAAAIERMPQPSRNKPAATATTAAARKNVAKE